MISYAQNYEDVILNRIFKNLAKGIYVDVGANDPIEDNITYHFYLKGWTGINFEPNQTYFKKLQNLRPNDTNIDLGCSDKEETLEFKEVANTGLSSFSSEYDDLINPLGHDIIKHQIKCVPLKKVFEEQKMKHIDFMSIDVEGFELNVLKGNDWDKYRPKVILLEAIAPNRQDILTYGNFEPFLENVGYKLRYFDGLNTFFTDTKNTNIPDTCFYPPNVFDSFEKYTVLKKTERIEDKDEFYSDNKLKPLIIDKLIKLRTKDIIYIFFKRISKKFIK